MTSGLKIIAFALVIIAGLACGPYPSPEPGSADNPPRAKEREVALDEVPRPVREAILVEAEGWKIRGVEEIRFHDRVEYEAEWREDGEEVELQCSADGTILSRNGDDDAVDIEDENTDDEDDDGEEEN